MLIGLVANINDLVVCSICDSSDICVMDKRTPSVSVRTSKGTVIIILVGISSTSLAIISFVFICVVFCVDMLELVCLPVNTENILGILLVVFSTSVVIVVAIDAFDALLVRRTAFLEFFVLVVIPKRSSVVCCVVDVIRVVVETLEFAWIICLVIIRLLVEIGNMLDILLVFFFTVVVIVVAIDAFDALLVRRKAFLEFFVLVVIPKRSVVTVVVMRVDVEDAVDIFAFFLIFVVIFAIEDILVRNYL
jgi:hypothetical protein